MNILSKTRITILSALILALFFGTANSQNNDSQRIIAPKDVYFEPDTPEWKEHFAVDMSDTKLSEKPTINLEGATHYQADYRAKWGAFTLGSLKIETMITESAYEISYRMRQKGVARWFSQQDTDTIARGTFSGADLKMNALYYFSENSNSGDKDQIVELARKDNSQRFHLYTLPAYNLKRPVTTIQTDGTVDALSALVHLGYTAVPEGASPCDRLIRVFDGKRLFNMRMWDDGTKTLRNRPKGRYEGAVHRCRVAQDKLGGYKQKDLDEKDNGKAYVFLAKVPDALSRPSMSYIPVMLRGSGAILEAKNPTITTPDGTVLNMGTP